MSINVNYKLLDNSNADVKPIDQLLFIFNRLYGGDQNSEISDSVSIVAEAGILEIAATHVATDFYQNRAGVEYEIYQYLQNSFKDYFLNCTSVFLLNLDFDDSYQNAILKVSAEAQKIQEKTNLLNGTSIQGTTSIEVAKISQQMNVAKATIEGLVYSKIQASKANAIKLYYNKLITATQSVATFTGTASKIDLDKFFYLLVREVDPGPQDDSFSEGSILVHSYRHAHRTVSLTSSNSRFGLQAASFAPLPKFAFLPNFELRFPAKPKTRYLNFRLSYLVLREARVHDRRLEEERGVTESEEKTEDAAEDMRSAAGGDLARVLATTAPYQAQFADDMVFVGLPPRVWTR